MSATAPVNTQITIALRSIRSGNYNYAFDVCNSLQWGVGLSHFTRARCLFILLLLAPLFPIRVPDRMNLARQCHYELDNVKKDRHGRRNEIVGFMKGHVSLTMKNNEDYTIIGNEDNIKRWAGKIEPGASAEKKARTMKKVKEKNEEDSHHTEADQERIPVANEDEQRGSVSDDEGVKLGIGDDLPLPDEDEKILAGLREKDSLS